MRKVKYRLSAEIKKITYKALDVFGNEHIIVKYGCIQKVFHWRDSDEYAVHEPNFEYIKTRAMEEGITTIGGAHIRVAKIWIHETVHVPDSIVVEFNYWIFKPRVWVSTDKTDVPIEVKEI